MNNKKTYDEIYLENLHEIFGATKQRSFGLLNLVANDVIADIGCGIGKDVWKMALSGARVFGIDHDPEFIRIAREKNGSPRIEYICCEANQIPLDSELLDKIRADRIFQHIDDPEPVIREAYRILKPGGNLQIIDADYLSMSMFLDDKELERKIIEAFACKRFNGGSQLRKIPGLLGANNFEISSISIDNYIFKGLEEASSLLRFDKVIKEEFTKGNISSREFDTWNLVKNQHFHLSVNLMLIMAKKLSI